MHVSSCGALPVSRIRLSSWACSLRHAIVLRTASSASCACSTASCGESRRMRTRSDCPPHRLRRCTAGRARPSIHTHVDPHLQVALLSTLGVCHDKAHQEEVVVKVRLVGGKHITDRRAKRVHACPVTHEQLVHVLAHAALEVVVVLGYLFAVHPGRLPRLPRSPWNVKDSPPPL